MKTLAAGVALALALSAAAFAAEKTETLKVSGWHCGGCAARTESALKDVKGVSKVATHRDSQSVTVTYDDGKAHRADLEKAVAESGFTVVR